MVTFLIKHEGGNSAAGIGTGPSLTTNADGGTAPTVLVLGSGDGTSRHWHDDVGDG